MLRVVVACILNILAKKRPSNAARSVKPLLYTFKYNILYKCQLVSGNFKVNKTTQTRGTTSCYLTFRLGQHRHN